jgi:hypothetical protein
MLSAHARPFHPSYEPANFCIFNDGIPSLVMTSEHDVLEILHGIQDSAIDENFPPTAEDAAELEAVQAFVEMMATLAFLEEHEEKARFSFDHFEKRWETRRSQGLLGRPNAARGTVQPADHRPRPCTLSKALAKAGTAHGHPSIVTTAKYLTKYNSSKLQKLPIRRNSRPIQQPRKQN